MFNTRICPLKKWDLLNQKPADLTCVTLACAENRWCGTWTYCSFYGFRVAPHGPGKSSVTGNKEHWLNIYERRGALGEISLCPCSQSNVLHVAVCGFGALTKRQKVAGTWSHIPLAPCGDKTSTQSSQTLFTAVWLIWLIAIDAPGVFSLSVEEARWLSAC